MIEHHVQIVDPFLHIIPDFLIVLGVHRAPAQPEKEKPPDPHEHRPFH
jgi:hypothetical protein